MKSNFSSKQGGFTLIELLVAMAITSILVLAIMGMTSRSIDIFKIVRDEVTTESQSRVALDYIAADMQSMQMNLQENEYQWLHANVDAESSLKVNGMDVPKSINCVFFTCAMDRNPAVGSDYGDRSSYRSNRADYINTQGDVNAVGYRLLYHDQVLNLSGRNNKERAIYPVFSLYRQVVPPRNAFEELMGKVNLEGAYAPFKTRDREFFLCENILDMNVIFTLQYADDNADTKKGRPQYAVVSVPVVDTRGKAQSLKVFGNRIEVAGKTYRNARLVSADISVTVVKDEGMDIINQVRLGNRPAPKAAEFIRRYCVSKARRVELPQPL